MVRMPTSQPAGSWPACDVWFWRGRSVPEVVLSVASQAELDQAARQPHPVEEVAAATAAGLLRLAAAEFVLGDLSIYDRRTFARGLDVDRECSACEERHGRPRLPIRRLHVAVTHTRVGADALVVVAASAAGEVGLAVGAAGGAADVRRDAAVAAVADGPHPPAPEVELPAAVPGLATAAADGAPVPCWLDDLDLGSGVAGAVAVRTDEEIALRVADAASLLD